MPQYNFGTGQLYAMPVGGGAPVRVGALQDVSVDFTGDTKSLFGQYQYALDTARGKTKIEGKFGTGSIDVAAYNQLFFGQTLTTASEKRQAIGEAGAVPAVGPYTVVAANGASFYLDLGVINVTTGQALKQVAAAPASGQYTVNANGTYTFAAADANMGVLLNYLYTATTASSATLNIANQLMGSAPEFQLVASQVYKGKSFTLVLYACIADKLSLPLKMDDYTISDVSYTAHANSANMIGMMTTSSAGV